MAGKNNSLREQYPKRVDIPVYLVLLLGLLITSQCLPVISIKEFVFWKDKYSLWSGMIGMFEHQQYMLGFIILVFSIIFPITKLCSLLVLWFGEFTDDQRKYALKWLEILGRWSMLEVFVVGIIVVISKSGAALDASPKIGIYLFAIAVLLSLAMALYIHRLARQLVPRTET